MRYEKNFLITIIALVFVIRKHSLQWRGEFHLYFGPVPEFLLVNSAARRFSMAASFEGNFLSSFLYWCFHWPYLVVQVYELITRVRRANENAGNLISVVQFLINIYIKSKFLGHHETHCDSIIICKMAWILLCNFIEHLFLGDGSCAFKTQITSKALINLVAPHLWKRHLRVDFQNKSVKFLDLSILFQKYSCYKLCFWTYFTF